MNELRFEYFTGIFEAYADAMSSAIASRDANEIDAIDCTIDNERHKVKEELGELKEECDHLLPDGSTATNGRFCLICYSRYVE